MRRFLVWPSALLWPENLPNMILMRTLNDQLVDGTPVIVSNSTWQISRLKFFIIATYIMTILLGFDWICWIDPNNIVLSQLTGVNGFGIGSLVFHWHLIE